MTTAVQPSEELLVERVAVRPPVSRAQRLGVGISLVLLGLVTIWRFGIEGHHTQRASIRLGALNTAHVPHFVPVETTCAMHRGAIVPHHEIERLPLM